MIKHNSIPKKKNSFKFLALSTAAIASALSTAPAAVAQSSGDGFVDEIIVTALSLIHI